MKSAENSDAHVLRQPWPAFLDRLDGQPDAAFAEFYDFARRVFAACPPQAYWSVPPGEREDAVHEVVLHCCQDDFRLLRMYRDRGASFAAWFLMVARNRIVDRLRANRGHGAASPSDEARAAAAPDGAALPAERAVSRALLDIVMRHLEELGDICRLLLLGAAEGLKPRELVSVLGWPAEWNKKASDDLRDCRRRLKQSLQRSGMNPSDVWES